MVRGTSEHFSASILSALGDDPDKYKPQFSVCNPGDGEGVSSVTGESTENQYLSNRLLMS